MNIFKILCAFTLMSSGLIFELQAAESKNPETTEDWESITGSDAQPQEEIFQKIQEFLAQINTRMESLEQKVESTSTTTDKANARITEASEAILEYFKNKENAEKAKPETQEVSIQTEEVASTQKAWSLVVKETTK